MSSVVVGAGFGPLVEQGDGQALVEERRLLEPGPDRLEVEVHGLEDVGVGPEGDRRPGLVRVVERLVLRQRAAGDTVVEGHPEHVAHLADLDVEPAGEGVDHGGADTVQPAGHLVAAAAELPAGVQLREHQLDGGDVLAVALAGGDAAAVVDDGHAAVGAQRHVDAVGVAGEGLVHRVVDDLPHEVVQAALTGRADVHAGPLAHGVEAFEDLDRLGVVGRGGLELGGCDGRGYGSVRSVGSGGRVLGSGSRPGRFGLGHAAPSCTVPPRAARRSPGAHVARCCS